MRSDRKVQHSLWEVRSTLLVRHVAEEFTEAELLWWKYTPSGQSAAVMATKTQNCITGNTRFT